MFLLLRLMLREEYRMHVSHSSRTIFIAIPIFVLTVSLMLGLTLDRLLDTMPLGQMLGLANMGFFLYGLSVGAFGFLGRTYIERSQGRQNFLVATPSVLPLSFRKAFLGMYLRDVVFYLLIIIAPAMAGMLASVPLVHHDPISVVSAFSPIVLSFLYGISLSFAMSILYTRSLAVFLVGVGAFIGTIVGHGFLGLYGLDLVLPTLGLQFALPPFGWRPHAVMLYSGTTGLLILLFLVVAVSFVRERYESVRSSFEELLPAYLGRFRFIGKYQELVAKEFVDLVRSGTLFKMSLSFVAPLFFLSLSTWYVNAGLGIPVGFNTVFYAAMVGFFGVLLYSWLTNVDLADYYGTLPVTVPDLIRAKLLVFLMLALGISTPFVVGISVLNGETGILWLALPVLYITSVYMVVATAYLTGISPQSFLFNPNVLTKFTVVSLLPDLGLTILSFSLDTEPLLTAVGISLVCSVLLVGTFLFLAGIERKWSRTSFS